MMLIAKTLLYEQRQALDELPILWVTTNIDLDKLLDELENCEIIAVDTEFMKRDTFFPRLALIQINTGEKIYLLDVVKLYLDEFWAILAKIPTIVLHACGEDLGIYYLLSKLPALTNVFDTQIGLGFLTGELQIGYQKALSSVLNIEIDKEQSQSDWLQRPLTFEQEQYAVDDVRYLLALFIEIKQQLQQQQLWQYAVEDSQSYTKEIYDNSQQSDQEIYLSMADYRYSRQQLAILQAICEWREQLARSINRPRTYILKRQALKEIVEEPPKTMRQLGFTSMRPDAIRMYGQELLTLIDQVRTSDQASYPPSLPPPYRSLSADVQVALEKEINQQSSITNLPSNILIRRKWLAEIYNFSLDEQQPLSMWLSGWRKMWVISQLVPILQNYIMLNHQDHAVLSIDKS